MAGNDSNALLLVHGSGTDASTNMPDVSQGGSTHTMVANANCQVDTALTDQWGGNAGVILLDGTGDTLSTGDSPDFDFGTGQLGIETWVRFNTFGGTEGIISHGGDKSSGGLAGWVIFMGGGKIHFRHWDTDSTISIDLDENWAPSTATWYNVAVARDGAGDFRFFIDGTMLGIAVNDASSIAHGTQDLIIGGLTDTSGLIDGAMGEVRISDTGRGWGDGGFTPETGPYTATPIPIPTMLSRNVRPVNKVTPSHMTW